MSDDPQQLTAPPATSGPGGQAAVVNGFVNVVRALAIPGLDVQRLSMAFRMSIDALEPGQPVELEGLFEFLVKELKAPEKQVLELCALLKSREAKLGVTFDAPAKLKALSPERQEKLTREANAKVASALGFDKTGDVALPPASRSGATPGQKAWRPEPSAKHKKKSGPRNMTPIYAGILAVVTIGAVVFYAWRQTTMLPPLHEIPVLAGPGLKCTKMLTMDGKVIICEIPKATFMSLGVESARNLAEITKRGLGSKVEHFYVRTAEDRRIVVTK